MQHKSDSSGYGNELWIDANNREQLWIAARRHMLHRLHNHTVYKIDMHDFRIRGETERGTNKIFLHKIRIMRFHVERTPLWGVCMLMYTRFLPETEQIACHFFLHGSVIQADSCRRNLKIPFAILTRSGKSRFSRYNYLQKRINMQVSRSKAGWWITRCTNQYAELYDCDRRYTSQETEINSWDKKRTHSHLLEYR